MPRLPHEVSGADSCRTSHKCCDYWEYGFIKYGVCVPPMALCEVSFVKIIHLIQKLKWAIHTKHAGRLGTTVDLEMDLKERSMLM